MTDFILIAVLAFIVGFAARYVYKARKSGAKCIGCPVKGGCSGLCGAGAVSSCGGETDRGLCHRQTDNTGT